MPDVPGEQCNCLPGFFLLGGTKLVATEQKAMLQGEDRRRCFYDWDMAPQAEIRFVFLFTVFGCWWLALQIKPPLELCLDGLKL